MLQFRLASSFTSWPFVVYHMCNCTDTTFQLTGGGGGGAETTNPTTESPQKLTPFSTLSQTSWAGCPFLLSSQLLKKAEKLVSVPSDFWKIHFSVLLYRGKLVFPSTSASLGLKHRPLVTWHARPTVFFNTSACQFQYNAQFSIRACLFCDAEFEHYSILTKPTNVTNDPDCYSLVEQMLAKEPNYIRKASWLLMINITLSFHLSGNGFHSWVTQKR